MVVVVLVADFQLRDKQDADSGVNRSHHLFYMLALGYGANRGSYAANKDVASSYLK